MRLAIVGCGSLGSLFAALLSPHVDLAVLGHWPAQIAHLRASGLTLVRPDGRRSTHRFPVHNDPAQLPPSDLALVLVKSHQTARAAAEIQHFLAADGLALTLQNGLGNVEILSAVLGSNRVGQGITALGANVPAPGVVNFAGHGPTHLARSAANQAHVQELYSTLQAAGLETHLADDLRRLAWGKLAINAAINPLTALLRVPNGFLAGHDLARQLLFTAAAETAAVARALAIDLPYPDAPQRALAVAQATAANRSSMLQDVLRGAPTEIDAICGAVVHHGRQSNVPTPLNVEYLRLIHSLPSTAPLSSTIPLLQSLLEQKSME